MQASPLTSLLSATLLGAIGLTSCGETTVVSTLPPGTVSPDPAAVGTTAPGTPSTGEEAPASQGASVAGPRLTFEQSVVDFGEVWDVADMVGAFPFKNTGNADLVFSDIKASCGCTTTELNPMTYAPGESNVIDLVWDPIGFGQQAKTITVQSNSVGSPVQVLTIKAKIKPFAQFNGSAVQLGNLQVGEEHRQSLELSCVDPNFQLLDLGASSRHVRVESRGMLTNGNHGVEVILDAAAPWGMLNSKVTAKVRGVLKETGEKVEHEVEMRIQGSIIHKLTVNPMLFAVGHVLPGRSFERVVRLERVDSQPFNVTKTELMNPVPSAMTVETEPYKIGAKHGVILRVKGQSGDYLGLISGQVRFETDIPGEGSHILPVLGKIRD